MKTKTTSFMFQEFVKNVPLFRIQFSAIPGVLAAIEHDVGDLEVRTPPEIAAELLATFWLLSQLLHLA